MCLQMASRPRTYPHSLPVRVSNRMRSDLRRIADREHLDVCELTRQFISEGIARLSAHPGSDETSEVGTTRERERTL
jgi:hypothetical protein